MTVERWAQIENFPQYEVSDQGRVRHGKTYRIRRLTIGRRYGYTYVSLAKIGDTDRKRTTPVYHFVARAFLGPKPSPKHEIAHNDGNPLNNAASNLRWATHGENMQDAVRHGRTGRATPVRGEANHLAKLTTAAVREIRSKYAANTHTSGQLGREYGVNPSHIRRIVKNLSWKEAA